MNTPSCFRTNILLFVTLLTIISFHQSSAQDPNSVMPTDTLRIPHTASLPVIDGKDGDDCWRSVRSQPIDQRWIPYGEGVAHNDFHGSYKVLWSAGTNLLYFCVDITDDVFVDGYRYDSDPKKGDFYYNFDMLEVFIDEDLSGGFHVFDGTGADVPLWGSSSVNAFAYHMILDAPADRKSATTVTACDLAGKSWDDYTIANYASHIKSFAMRKEGNRYIWEFSLAVYTDAYDPAKPERALSALTSGKRIGLSLAYCDNDDPNEEPKLRDNFFGSVFVPKEANNDHWKNADGFRKAILIAQ
jgi:hypothetical protein